MTKKGAGGGGNNLIMYAVISNIKFLKSLLKIS
jgi:hypothetical protein